MFHDQLEAAMEFYTATFPDSEIRDVARTGKDGSITSAEFRVGGQVFTSYNGGPYREWKENTYQGHLSRSKHLVRRSGTPL
jgi:predicted 3-demethylubiquinone-9 3-methyltransferase (glyoxalase superfamily)